MNHVAKIFMHERSQAVQLPKEFRFDSDEVFIRKQGDEVVISAKFTWDDFFDRKPTFDESFMVERN